MRSQYFAATLLTALLTLSVSADAAEYELETITSDLELPWSVAFLPDGRFLVATRPGTLQIVDQSGAVSEPLAGAPETYFAGQGGFFDVVLDRDFANNSRILLSYAYGTPEGNGTRVISADFSDEAISNIEVLFTASPLKDTL